MEQCDPTKYKYKLDKYEQEILRAYEAGEFRPLKNRAQELKKIQEAAREFLNKTKSINLRISNADLQKIKAKAVEKGLPYQTLIGSLLHRYSMGESGTSLIADSD